MERIKTADGYWLDQCEKLVAIIGDRVHLVVDFRVYSDGRVECCFRTLSDWRTVACGAIYGSAEAAEAVLSRRASAQDDRVSELEDRVKKHTKLRESQRAKISDQEAQISKLEALVDKQTEFRAEADIALARISNNHFGHGNVAHELQIELRNLWDKS